MKTERKAEMPAPRRSATKPAAPTSPHSYTRKLLLIEARPVFIIPWTCLDHSAALHPLDRDSTGTTSELVPGALLLDYMGKTTTSPC